jgi:hypothetical protein
LGGLNKALTIFSDVYEKVALYGALARRTATVVSPTYCDLDVLLKSDFLNLVKEFPDMQARISGIILPCFYFE